MAGKAFSTRGGYAPFLIPGILLFTLLIVLPFLVNIGLSFTRWSGVGPPEWIGLANYQKAFADVSFWASFRNILLLIVAMTIIPTIVGLLLATFLFDYIAHNFGQAAASFFRAGYYLPQIVPLVVAAMVWRWIYQPDWGVLNSLLRVVGLGPLQRAWLGDPSTAMPAIMGMMVWFQIGYPLVIFMAAMQRVDPELYEAAALDGASWWRKFVYVTVPLIRAEVYVVMLTTAIHALKVFEPIYAMTRGGPGRTTLVAAYFSYQNFFERSSAGYGATIATVLTSVIMVVSALFILVQAQRERREYLG